ncbi:MAG TPA: cytochrome c3 family protein [Kofleriaceae bacterium]|nr:cytochrome c3 family protein [Kofleriaceae bacterium]
MPRWSYGITAAGVVVALAAVGGSCARPDAISRTAPESQLGPDRLVSNALRGDYAGSDECGMCHPAIYAAWERSPMRNMTRMAAGAEIRAPESGRFELGGDVAIMHTEGGARFMTLQTAADGERVYRITRVIGGRVREDFVGIEVTGAPDPVAAPGVGEELVLPVSYIYSNQRWRYKGYSVLVRARDRLRAGPPWRTRCILCHNTAPYLVSLYDDLLGESLGGYQGSMSTNLFEPDRRWRVEVGHERQLTQAIADELRVLGATPAGDDLGGLLRQGIETTRERFSGDHLIEVGIGCEGCHNGAAAHADDPAIRPSFAVRGPVTETWGPAGHVPGRSESINRMCMRCHTVLFSRYAHTWEGGHRYRDPGGSPMNSGEARDFWLGGCATELACTGCHDPHAKDDSDALRVLDTVAGNGVCTACHAELAPAAALADHTHHDPTGPGSACLECHMPRKNLGLDYRLTRYHRIGSPNEQRRVEGDRPLECALCHADRSAEHLVGAMERWWGRSFDRERLRELYGDLSAPVMEATLRRGKPHEQAVAAAVLGRTNDPDRAATILPLLRHRYPLVRYYAAQAIEDLLGEWPPVDLAAPPREIRAESARWLRERARP